MRVARVLIDGPSELVFDYCVPDGLPVLAGCRVRIPLRRALSTGTVLSIDELPHPEARGFSLRPIDSLTDPEPLLTPKLLELAQWVAEYYACRLEGVVRALLPEAVRTEENSAKAQKIVTLARPATEILPEISPRATRQHLIIGLLAASPGQTLTLSELGATAGSAVKSLAERGFVTLATREIRRDPEADGDDEILPSTALPLSDEQQQALAAVTGALDSSPGERRPLLLHGVTGSGKTEIYLRAARHALDQGKTVLVLVPEISLTPQTVRRFRARFADIQNQIAVLHSHLSQGERFDEWHRIRKGVARIVIGARSAVFAPLPELGLLIVDEEHENSYKQDQVPRYHGRDVAVLRAHLEGATVLLGSATPSLESWHNTLTGKYQLLRLTRRVDDQSLPLIRVVDMRLEARKQRSKDAFLSDPLRAALHERLAADQQAILFLNRRGYARSLQCPACGHVCQCPHCSLALTYHRSTDRLMCHICGHQAVVPRRCPECRDPAIVLQGFGTQKVEDVFRKVFPTARIARVDADAMHRKHALRDLLNAFRARKYDILIGTQMIAKGLHFPNVTLVGILNADIGLHIPDFRAGERVFQLITQVSGRAGRGNLKGEVIIQTFTPHSPSIQFARHHDFDGFAAQELEIRQQFHFPPYTHCAMLTSRSTHERRAEFTLETIHRKLSHELPSGIMLGEPLPSPLVKAHGQFRFQFMLRAHHPRTLTRHVRNILAPLTIPEDVTLVFDMDALNFT